MNSTKLTSSFRLEIIIRFIFIILGTGDLKMQGSGFNFSTFQFFTRHILDLTMYKDQFPLAVEATLQLRLFWAQHIEHKSHQMIHTLVHRKQNKPSKFYK